jgi:hypothetical protein
LPEHLTISLRNLYNNYKQYLRSSHAGGAEVVVEEKEPEEEWRRKSLRRRSGGVENESEEEEGVEGEEEEAVEDEEEDERGKRSPSAKEGKESTKPGEDDEIQKLISAKSDELDRGGKDVRTSGTSSKPKWCMVEASMASSDSE